MLPNLGRSPAFLVAHCRKKSPGFRSVYRVNRRHGDRASDGWRQHGAGRHEVSHRVGRHGNNACYRPAAMGDFDDLTVLDPRQYTGGVLVERTDGDLLHRSSVLRSVLRPRDRRPLPELVREYDHVLPGPFQVRGPRQHALEGRLTALGEAPDHRDVALDPAKDRVADRGPVTAISVSVHEQMEPPMHVWRIG